MHWQIDLSNIMGIDKSRNPTRQEIVLCLQLAQCRNAESQRCLSLSVIRLKYWDYRFAWNRTNGCLTFIPTKKNHFDTVECSLVVIITDNHTYIIFIVLISELEIYYLHWQEIKCLIYLCRIFKFIKKNPELMPNQVNVFVRSNTHEIRQEINSTNLNICD